MNIPPQAIWIIAAVFVGGFLLMIPFGIMQSKRKKQALSFTEGNSEKAILHLYADSPVIDGTAIKNMEHVRGADLQTIVALSPGQHSISAKYTSSEASLGKNVNYKTPKPIDSTISFEAGHEYTLALYFYDPEQRKEYYKGDVGEDIYTQELDISGGAGAYAKAYIICYREKQNIANSEGMPLH